MNPVFDNLRWSLQLHLRRASHLIRPLTSDIIFSPEGSKEDLIEIYSSSAVSLSSHSSGERQNCLRLILVQAIITSYHANLGFEATNVTKLCNLDQALRQKR